MIVISLMPLNNKKTNQAIIIVNEFSNHLPGGSLAGRSCAQAWLVPYYKKL